MNNFITCPINLKEQKNDAETLVIAIAQLSILNSKYLHIEFEYTPWLLHFEVKVFNVNTNYMLKHSKIIGASIYLDSDSAIEQLEHFYSNLSTLIFKAKKSNLVFKKKEEGGPQWETIKLFLKGVPLK